MFLNNLPASFLAAGPTTDAEVTGSVGGLVLYIAVALGVSFLCSVLEAVLLSSSLSHIEGLAQQGSRAGHIMRQRKANLEQSISAILTLNTIAHTVGAAGAGAQAVGVFGSAWVGVISAVLTLLILVLSEIIPKTIGAAYWKQLTPFAAYAIQGMVWILYPVVVAFQRLGRLLAPKGHVPSVTRAELEMMATIGTGEGALEEREYRILRNLLRLSGVRTSDIMTPRTVVFALPKTMMVSEVLAAHKALPYSRIPVYEKSVDDTDAYVLRQDVLAAVAADRDQVTLQELARPIHSIPESMTVARLLDEFMERQEQIFLVFDEYGGTAGIATMEDAIESLLGVEITDEKDLVADLQVLARQRYARQRQRLGLRPDESADAQRPQSAAP